MQAIRITIRSIGNGKGVLLPEPVLAKAGLADATAVALTVEGDAIILRSQPEHARAGWADAARKIAAAGDDAQVIGEFGNDADADLTW